MFGDITGLHTDWMDILHRTLADVEELEIVVDKSRRQKYSPHKARQTAACRKKLTIIVGQVNKDLVTMDAICIKMESYHHVRRRRFLKEDEQVFLDAVLSYLPLVSDSIFKTMPVVGNGLPQHAANLRGQLRWAIGHQEILYKEICTSYANLQLAVLG